MTVSETATPDARALRNACGQFLTGVTLITSTDGVSPIGVTVNSFTSVSLDPPMVAFCAHKQSRIRAALAACGRYAVNILAEDQEYLARRFSSKDTVCFGDTPARLGVTGIPVLTEVLACLECHVVEEIEVGDHTIVLGEVIAAGQPRPQARPLTFFRGTLQ